jgi:hypothetical protein
VTDKLTELALLAATLHDGDPAFRQRLGEMSGGFPSQGDGGHGGSASSGGPTLAAVIAKIDDRRSDVADLERSTYERHIGRALTELQAALRVYDRIVQRRIGVSKLEDPGCELCAKVPCGGTLCKVSKDGTYRCELMADARHWCAKYASVPVITAGRKGQPDVVTRVVLCSSCYEFNRPDAAARLPTHDEVLDHVEGRRRRWKVPASARMIG